jgi:hypothetical protein
MVQTSCGDFYIYEPVQLNTNRIVVPLFFFSIKRELCSKCVAPVWIPEQNGPKLRGVIPGNLPFSSDQLETVCINDFFIKYDEIVGEDHVHLSQRCGGIIYGMFLSCGVILNKHCAGPLTFIWGQKSFKTR